MFNTLALAGVAAFSICLAPDPAFVGVEASPKFDVAEGVCLDKIFRARTSMTSMDFRVFMGGQPVPSEFLPKLEIVEEHSMSVRVQDTYGKSKDGQLLSFVREYAELAGEGSISVEVPPQAPEESNWQHESGLIGERIAFHWDVESEAFEPELEGGGECPEPMDRLDAQMDLLGFLPGKDVEEGASWKVEASVLQGLFSPGGPLGLDEDEALAERPYEYSSLEGELTVTLVSVGEENGERVATLRIEGECEQTAEREGDLTPVPVAEGAATDTGTWEYLLEGDLEWNLSAGHAISLDISGTYDHLLRTDRDPGQGGADYASEIEWEGRLELHVQFERVRVGEE